MPGAVFVDGMFSVEFDTMKLEKIFLPRVVGQMARRSRTLRVYHRTSAIVLGLFLMIHLANHVAGLAGQDEHIAFMHSVRPLYRNASVEPLLLALFVSQIVSGVVMVARGWSARRGMIAWLQAGSGLYLAAFVTVHILSVLSGRTLLHLDTDFRFAAAGFHVPGWPWFFWPYYALAVLALFAHIGCAICWTKVDNDRRTAVIAFGSMMTTGAALGLMIVSMLGGALYQVDIPARYKATYTGG